MAMELRLGPGVVGIALGSGPLGVVGRRRGRRGTEAVGMVALWPVPLGGVGREVMGMGAWVVEGTQAEVGSMHSGCTWRSA